MYDRDSRRGRDLTGRLRNSAEKGINLYNELHVCFFVLFLFLFFNWTSYVETLMI